MNTRAVTVVYFRDGPQCEKCKESHYLSPAKDKLGRQACEPCDCHPNGAFTKKSCYNLLGDLFDRIQKYRLFHKRSVFMQAWCCWPQV